MARMVLWGMAFIAGLSFFTFLALFRHRISDRGYTAFLFPLIPGFAYVLVEFSFLFLPAGINSGDAAFPFLVGAESLVFSCMGLSCALFYEAQYRVNGASRKGLLPLKVFVFLAAANYSLLALRVAVPGTAAAAERFVPLSVYFSLLYAGPVTVLIIRRKNPLPPSAWAGIISAGIGLFYYPFFALTDIFALPVPFLDPARPIRLQAYPVYYLAVCAVLLPFFLRSALTGASPQDATKPALTRREEELALLLLDGATSAQIAAEFGVSVSTVKSHTRNLYRKLNAHSRRDLAALMGRGGA